MDGVLLGEWLDKQGATEFGKHLLLMLSAQMTMDTMESTVERTSVFGVFGILRTYLTGEGGFPVLYPDNREGLCVPIAHAIEQRGGSVWRKQRVTQILIEDGTARGVVLRDGTEVRAPQVAIATGNSRLRAILDPLPAELEEPLTTHCETADFFTYTTLDQPVAGNLQAVTGILGADGSNIGWLWPQHAISPWTTKPGEQLLVACTCTTTAELAEPGSKERLTQQLNDLQEAYFPGFKDATSSQESASHGHLWYDQIAITKKVPRTIDSIRNLWFVGEGSAHSAGIGFEAAASAGVQGALSITEANSR
jgi:phytoene dehydrogenase-like protein